MVNPLYSKVRELKKYAIDEHIPIMADQGIDFLTTYILKHQVTNILEIGTAIGYSAIMMALVNPKVKVTTIERDQIRYMEAVKNVKKFGLEDRITLIFQDALEVNIEGTFDLIFIDAAKGQNIKFFERFEKNLAVDGSIITDNMGFHGLVAKDENEIASKNLRSLVRKIKDYITYLRENQNYMTTFYFEVGDGLAVSKRK